jgi:hypothetical protein
MEILFEEKFSECINCFEKLSSPSFSRNEISLYSDYVELLALFSRNGFISYGDIQDRFFGTKEYANSNERDEDESLIIEIFLMLQERELLYSKNYPFKYDNDNSLIKVNDDLTGKQKLYIYLLISSMLSIFNPFRNELTSEFEFICKDAMVCFLPNYSVVKQFGRNSDYDGNTKEKIKKLASDLNLSIDEYELMQISDRNYQERGLDIVGWIPFSDNCMNIIIFLAQCACGKDYESKQHDTRRFRNYMRFYKTEPIHVMFIPYSLINPKERKFYHSDLIEKDYLIFERKRIIELYNLNQFNNYKSYQVVESVLKYKEYIV